MPRGALQHDREARAYANSKKWSVKHHEWCFKTTTLTSTRENIFPTEILNEITEFPRFLLMQE